MFEFIDKSAIYPHWQLIAARSLIRAKQIATMASRNPANVLVLARQTAKGPVEICERINGKWHSIK